MIGQPVSEAAYDAAYKYGIDTNWRDVIFDGHAPTYTLDASVRGGGSNTSYYLSVNHHDQEGIIDQSGIRRESLRFNFDARIKKWLKVGMQSNLGFSQYEQNNEIQADRIYGTNPAYFARITLPYDSPYYYTFDEMVIYNGARKQCICIILKNQPLNTLTKIVMYKDVM